jgi:hypothetical protein
MFSKFGKKLKDLVSGNEKNQNTTAVVHRWVDREPRLNAEVVSNVHCYFEINHQLVRFEIRNMSISGIAIDRNSGTDFEPSPEAGVIAVVELEGKRYSVPMLLKRVEPDLLAFQYQKRDFDFESHLRKKFNVEIAALKMMKMRPELLDQIPEGKPHLFSGKSDCRLFYIEKNGEIIQFEIGFFGNVIEGFRGASVRFSNVLYDTPSNVQYAKSHMMNTFAGDLPQLKEEASRFLDHISGLEPSAKLFIEQVIQKEVFH